MSSVVGQPGTLLRLLQLEDNADDATLAVNALEEGGFRVEETRASGRAQFEAFLVSGANYDVILADYVLPGYDGREALAFARAMRPDIPFFIISGQIGEEHAIEMLKAGATDYVLKQRMKRLVPALTRALRDRERERVREATEHLIRSLSQQLHERTLLEEVISQMPAGVLIAEAPRGNIVTVNQRYADIVGIAREELHTLRDLERNLPLRRDGTRYPSADLACTRALELGAVVRPEILQYGTGPSARIAVAHAAPVRGDDGRIVAVVATLADITDQVSMEADRNRLRDEVADERELSRAVIEQMPASLVLVDGDGRVRLANEAARELLKASLHEGTALAESEYQLLRPGTNTRCAAADRPVFRALREGVTVRGEEYDVHPAGTASTQARTVAINAAPIRDRSGRVSAAVTMMYDVTDRRRLDAELRAQLGVRERVMSVVSHDLRTPLGTIMLSAENLQRQTTDPHIRRSLEVMARSARRMERITRDLLDLGRLRAGGAMSVHREARDLRPILERTVEEAAAAYPDATINLQLTPGSLDGWVDSGRIAQAVGNLLSNAVQHGERGSPVQVEGWRAGDEVAIRVQNRGKPIPREMLPHIFEPFRRATDEEAAGSVGLGLFIVQQIAVAHDGRVEVESSEESGTRITIRLPALRPAHPALEDQPPTPEA